MVDCRDLEDPFRWRWGVSHAERWARSLSFSSSSVRKRDSRDSGDGGLLEDIVRYLDGLVGVESEV